MALRLPKIQFHTITDGKFRGGTANYTTCGYWWWSEPNNKGTLHIEARKYDSLRYAVAVFGHELIEALWCWFRGITTEESDLFDDLFEHEYELGLWPKTVEGGFDPRAPYRVGHILGFVWECVWIHISLASWKKYGEECDRQMSVGEYEQPKRSQSKLP